MTLYCEGGVTLVFPTEIPADSAGAISLDWVAGKMRYQIDRKFARCALLCNVELFGA